MATYYLKTVSGNDANNGSSLALAKKTLDAFQGLITAGDIIRIDAAESVTTPAKLATGVGTSFPSVMITPLTTDSINAKLEVTRGTTASPTALFTTGTHYFSKMDILTIYNSSTVTNSFFGNNTIGSGIFRNCTITAKQLNASVTSLVNPLPTLTLLDVENCVIDGSNQGSSNYYFRINGLPAGSKLIKNKFINIRVVDESSNAFLNLVTAGVIFSYNIVEALFASTALSVLIKLNTLSCYVYKNTILLTSAASTNNRAAFSYSSGGVINYGQVYDNIIYYNDVNAPYYIYGAGAGYTITNPYTIPAGNNVAYGQTGIAFNLTNFQENYGALVTLSGNPFLSLSNSSSDFLKIDISAAASSAVLNSGYFDPDSNIGFDGVDPGAGAAPNAYDLRAGVTVGAVTGTLVVPAVADVRVGVNYDVAPNAKTGLLNLPAEADVKVGVSYDNATKTGSFDYSTLFSDPGIANVKTGVDYKYNSLTNNRSGTYTAYPLLAAANVKIGVDIGDGSFGTYDGSDRWSDPGIANVTLAVAYKANSLTNNRVGTNESTDPGVANVVAGVSYKINSTNFSGTRTAIYSLLPINEVKIDVDRGDGQLGTYVAAERYTNPGESNVKTGISYLYNANTLNGSYTAYPLLPANRVQFNYDRGDGSFGTDKGELFNDAIIASELAIGVSKQNLGNTIVGTYNASERYTFIPEDKVEINFDYLYDAEEFTGTFAGGGATDYPTEDKVLFSTIYAFGLKTGTLGKYNKNLLNVTEQLNNNALIVMRNVLGSEWQDLKYFKDVAKNDFYSNTKQFGIRPLTDLSTKEVIGLDTIDLDFEIKLTTDFENRDDDVNERNAELFLQAKMEEIRRQFRMSKFGNFSNIMLIKDFRRDETEKVNDTIILCRAVITVSFGILSN